MITLPEYALKWKIALIRFDVYTRGSDAMADLVACSLRETGMIVDQFHARGSFCTKLQLEREHYQALSSRHPLLVLSEVAARSWRKYDLLITDFIPIAFSLALRNRDRLLYLAQSHIVECYETWHQRTAMEWLYRQVLVRWRIPLLCASPALLQVFSQKYGIRPQLIQRGERERLFAFADLQAEPMHLPRSRQHTLLAIVGTNHAKGVDILAQVLDELDTLIGDELEVRLVGAPLAWQPLRTHMRHLGFVTPAQLRSVYEQTDAFLFTSRFENFPSPPFEAMLCDCAVVSTPVAEYLCDRKNALLAPSLDAVSIAECVVTLLQDINLCKYLTLGGHRTVAQMRRELEATPPIWQDIIRCVAEE